MSIQDTIPGKTNQGQKNTSRTPSTVQDQRFFPSEDPAPCDSVGGESGVRTLVSRTPQIVNHNFDTLDFTLKIRWKDGLLFTRLKDEKASLQKENKQEINVKFTESGLFSWNLRRYGNKLYGYVLTTGDISLCLSSRSHESRIPNAAFHIGSLSCHNNWENLFKMLGKWLKRLGGELLEIKPSRVDYCRDIVGNIEETGITDINRVVTRANYSSIHTHRRKVTGVQFGKSTILFRAYDKLQEMKEKQDIEKALRFYQEIWKIPLSTPVTRVEFQIRREALKEMGIDTLKDLLRKKDDLWKYLTTEWFRHTEKPVDRENKNQRHSKISAFWEAVSEIKKRTIDIVRDRTQKFIHYKALMSQARGLLLNIVAATGVMAEDGYGIIDTASNLIRKELMGAMLNPGFNRDYERRQTSALIQF